MKISNDFAVIVRRLAGNAGRNGKVSLADDRLPQHVGLIRKVLRDDLIRLDGELRQVHFLPAEPPPSNQGTEFRAVINGHDGMHADPAHCESCGWRGLFKSLKPVGVAELMPGDPSPAGRCPKCDALAYLARPIDAQRWHGPKLAAALEAIAGTVAMVLVSKQLPAKMYPGMRAIMQEALAALEPLGAHATKHRGQSKGAKLKDAALSTTRHNPLLLERCRAYVEQYDPDELSEQDAALALAGKALLLHDIDAAVASVASAIAPKPIAFAQGALLALARDADQPAKARLEEIVRQLEALFPIRRTGPLGMRVCEPSCHSAAACLNPDNCKADMTWENNRADGGKQT